MTGSPLEEPELPPSLRFLKRLVTVLTLVMILGVIAMVGLLVTRLPQGNAAPVLPQGLVLPAGARIAAVTLGTGWTAIVTTQDQILIYDSGGTLRQSLKIDFNLP